MMMPVASRNPSQLLEKTPPPESCTPAEALLLLHGLGSTSVWLRPRPWPILTGGSHFSIPYPTPLVLLSTAPQVTSPCPSAHFPLQSE